jgi:predicted acylesterase/phospholipase RssA
MTLWGPLADRYEDVRPRKMLALDGGGIRGIITLEILIEIERLLAEATGEGKRFRLCNFFDYIAGTSTGAIIAAGLARGMTARTILDFYVRTGAVMFARTFLMRRLKHLYRAEPLARELKAVLGARTTLFPQHLRCLLLVVTHNVTTDSPWPISSNPLAKYNDPALPDCNLVIPLWQLVRASTAAPVYFPPEVVQWDPTDPEKTFVFVDGGVTPYNNPAFLLFRMATQAPFRLNWKTGERDLLLMSVGTGSAPQLDADVASPGQNHISTLVSLPGALMYGASMDQDINARMIGRCVFGAPIDSELGDLIPRDPAGQPIPLSHDLGRAFLYARYNADLSSQGLSALGLSDINPQRVGQLDATDSIPALQQIGGKVAEQVRLEHFGSFL